MPRWWPTGADEQIARDCNCDYCAELIEALEEYRRARETENQTLRAFQ